MSNDPRKREKVTGATLELLAPFKKLVHTITSDNGKEFAYHEHIAVGLDLIFTLRIPTILGSAD